MCGLLNLEEVLSGKVDDGWFVQLQPPIIPLKSNLLIISKENFLHFRFWTVDKMRNWKPMNLNISNNQWLNIDNVYVPNQCDRVYLQIVH